MPHTFDRSSSRSCPFAEVDDGEEIEFKCDAKMESYEMESKDSIKFKISTDYDGLKVEVEYEQEMETETSETESETKYEIVFDRIVEYRKATTTGVQGAYDWDESNIVSELLLTNFRPFSQIGVYDGNKYSFSITSTDGMATFTFTISQGGVNEALTANKMKIDFELNGYGWTRDDTYVALLSHVESEREVEVDYEDGDKRKTEDVKISFEDAIQGTGIKPFGEFTWAKEAEVRSVSNEEADETEIAVMTSEEDSVTISVIATSPTDDSGKVAFSFVGESAMAASSIYWDPEAGISYGSDDDNTSGASSLVLTSLVAVLSAFSIFLLM